MNKTILSLLIACLVCVPAAGFPQAKGVAAFDTSRMQRDLEIMEAILDRLFDGSNSSFGFTGGGSRGIYMPGYGVLFQVPQNHFAFQIFTELERAQSLQTSKPRASGSVRSKVTARSRLARSDIRESLQNFFTNYADAIGQIDNNERVAVYIQNAGNSVFVLPSTEEAAAASGLRDIFAAARKADIIARRSGALVEAEFNKRMQYRELTPGEEDTDLEVMARIVDTALGGKNQGIPRFEGDTRPVYLEGVGALFLLRTRLTDPTSAWFFKTSPKVTSDIEELQTMERHVAELAEASKRAQSTWQTRYDDLRTRLAEIIADYGHTLRRLQGNEWIIVAADLQDAPETGPRELVCRVQKNAIDAYNNRTISREQLLRKINYLEY